MKDLYKEYITVAEAIEFLSKQSPDTPLVLADMAPVRLLAKSDYSKGVIIVSDCDEEEVVDEN